MASNLTGICKLAAGGVVGYPIGNAIALFNQHTLESLQEKGMDLHVIQDPCLLNADNTQTMSAAGMLCSRTELWSACLHGDHVISIGHLLAGKHSPLCNWVLSWRVGCNIWPADGPSMAVVHVQEAIDCRLRNHMTVDSIRDAE